MSRRRLLFPLIAILLVASGAFVANVLAGNTPSLGLDLQGGASVTMKPVGDYDPEALNVAVDIIRQRVDSIGVAEPEIQRQGDNVVVNLPGVKDQQEALDLIGRTGAVEMRPVINLAENPDLTTTTSAAPGATTTTVKGATTTLAPPAGGVGSSRTRAETTTTTTVPGTDPETGLKPGQTVLPGRKDGLIYLLGPAEATGEVFSNDASVQVEAGSFSVVANLRNGPAGEDQWNALARKCYDGGEECPTKQIAIVLDGEVISAPTVQTPTFTGSVSITGSFTRAEADELRKILQFGAVPVQFETPTVQTVSATLGKDSLRAAIISGILGVLLVLLFLIFYYRLIALVVVAGLGVSGLLLWSIISWLSKTNGLALTLSGAAGIIVSIGVTVDSYVVFFEKLKDDVQAGRTLRNSASRGFESAWRTILIADTASLIGAIVLWWLTVGSVRGFAFFLGLSTLSDIVVSYFFTRPTVLLLSRTRLFSKGRVLGVRGTQTSVEVA
ncbi:MAG: protein translocase subunit SecD [Acidimicrobiaceae bacterium]|jgi:preprotein translocase subunit SecD